MLVQSYEKSRAKQKNSFLFLPRWSKFAIFDGRVTKKREHYKEICFFFCRDGVSSPSLMAKLRKKSDFRKQFRRINLCVLRDALKIISDRQKNKVELLATVKQEFQTLANKNDCGLTDEVYKLKHDILDQLSKPQHRKVTHDLTIFVFFSYFPNFSYETFGNIAKKKTTFATNY